MKRKRSKPRRRLDGAVIIHAYRAFLRRSECCVCGRPPPCDPHHHTQHRGLGQKSSDRYMMPMCRTHHDDIDRWPLKGHFKGWTLDALRAWQTDRADESWALWQLAQPSEPVIVVSQECF